MTDAPGTGTAPTGFGRPPSAREPSDVGLRVIARHRPVRAPGRNLLTISGSYDPTSGPAALFVTLNSTRRFNGCAVNDDQDRQITRADGGAVVSGYEHVTPSSSGDF